MKEFLQKHKIILHTLGPVFVGDGKVLVKREYVLNKRERKVTVIDQAKFFRYLMRSKKLESYERYILGKSGSMQSWMYEEKIPFKDLKSFTAYEYSCGDVAELNTMKNILTFIKDPYGMPYVPGSSLKGAIRTALLGADILKNHEKYSHAVDYFSQKTYFDCHNKKDIDREIKSINREIQRVEEIMFCTKSKDEGNQTVNDIMNGLCISDSKALSLEDLTLCQKIDIHVEGKETSLPILRECLKPETRIEFDVTIDTTECDLTIEQIRGSINLFLRGYNKLFLEKFKEETLYEKDVMYIGGGSGFATKTVLHELLKKSKTRSKTVAGIIDLNLPGKAKSEHKHSQDSRWGVSPHTCKLTEYDGGLYQMGACSVEIT
ncbi:CRISPR type III-A/MTUBE-associated RAMP protein Csm5 [uncultured Eubacterium sp.]|uniref:type III-A CRISPR-associated RAMP protein Csm5 n=1 Tax=Brotomerdimonas butyrica TaxID=2981721 RepID=UPI0008213024|nr:type III-A CRISPR-associated RAMP protein Csm5 [Brotomerdimonas butyrica]MCU6754801.1 type III-A CRISPR-associated RAMP protein Csm5 [Brotomerdimonas butyrica]SCG93960.1 CRISPR type III-A/MTUBE-associated RAMP protein Csm5 [uncultured Eubacterium sp.]